MRTETTDEPAYACTNVEHEMGSESHDAISIAQGALCANCGDGCSGMFNGSGFDEGMVWGTSQHCLFFEKNVWSALPPAIAAGIKKVTCRGCGEGVATIFTNCTIPYND